MIATGTTYHYRMFTGNKVMPFPCLAAQERKTSDDGPEYPFDHTGFILFMSRMPSQYHCNRADDQNECHHTHEGQWKIHMTRPGKCIEHYVRIRPEVLAETDTAVRDQEGPESESITHQEIPHHQFAILQVEGTFTSAPPF